MKLWIKILLTVILVAFALVPDGLNQALALAGLLAVWGIKV